MLYSFIITMVPYSLMCSAVSMIIFAVLKHSLIRRFTTIQIEEMIFVWFPVHVTFLMLWAIKIVQSHVKIEDVILGDLVTSFGEQLLPFVDNQNISTILTKGRRSKAAKTKSLALWATKEIRKLKTSKMENHS